MKNFEVCPLKHYEVDIAKNWKEDDSEQLQWGNEVHKAASNYVTKNTPLPVGMPVLQSWLDRLSQVTYDKILVEQKLAITKDFQPCGYFDRGVSFRTVVDWLGLRGPVALALDWKTGKIMDDAQQLALSAATCFAHFPVLHKIRTEFVWLKEGPDVSTREDFSRSDMATMWRNIWPRIEALERAYVTGVYPAKPGYLCRKWCPVKSCEFNGQ
jgi:hypothetical protein